MTESPLFFGRFRGAPSPVRPAKWPQNGLAEGARRPPAGPVRFCGRRVLAARKALRPVRFI